MTGKLLHFDCIFHFVWQHFAKSIQQYILEIAANTGFCFI